MRLSDGDPDRKWKHMSSEVFETIRKEVFPAALTVAISCGAEPLANPEFGSHLRSLYKSGVPYRQMVTNGTLFSEETIRTVLAYPPTSLFFSIDGSSCKTHASLRDGADLNMILGVIEKLITGRGRRIFPMIGFSTTLQRKNLCELADIVSLAHRAGAVSVGVVPLVPYEGLNTLEAVIDPTSAEATREISRARLRASQQGIAFSLSSEASDRRSAHPCPHLRSTVFIDPNGSIFPCPYWNTGHPLGNILDGFDNVWKSKGLERLRRGNFSEPDNCMRCPEVTGRTVEIRKARQ